MDASKTGSGPAQLPVKPKRLNKPACAVCHTKKCACDGNRPCGRCVRLNKQHLCVEYTPKPRGRKPQVPMPVNRMANSAGVAHNMRGGASGATASNIYQAHSYGVLARSGSIAGTTAVMSPPTTTPSNLTLVQTALHSLASSPSMLTPATLASTQSHYASNGSLSPHMLMMQPAQSPIIASAHTLAGLSATPAMATLTSSPLPAMSALPVMSPTTARQNSGGKTAKNKRTPPQHVTHHLALPTVSAPPGSTSPSQQFSTLSISSPSTSPSAAAAGRRLPKRASMSAVSPSSPSSGMLSNSPQPPVRRASASAYSAASAYMPPAPANASLNLQPNRLTHTSSAPVSPSNGHNPFLPASPLPLLSRSVSTNLGPPSTPKTPEVDYQTDIELMQDQIRKLQSEIFQTMVMQEKQAKQQQHAQHQLQQRHQLQQQQQQLLQAQLQRHQERQQLSLQLLQSEQQLHLRTQSVPTALPSSAGALPTSPAALSTHSLSANNPLSSLSANLFAPGSVPFDTAGLADLEDLASGASSDGGVEEFDFDAVPDPFAAAPTPLPSSLSLPSSNSIVQQQQKIQQQIQQLQQQMQLPLTKLPSLDSFSLSSPTPSNPFLVPTASNSSGIRTPAVSSLSIVLPSTDPQSRTAAAPSSLSPLPESPLTLFTPTAHGAIPEGLMSPFRFDDESIVAAVASMHSIPLSSNHRPHSLGQVLSQLPGQGIASHANANANRVAVKPEPTSRLGLGLGRNSPANVKGDGDISMASSPVEGMKTIRKDSGQNYWDLPTLVTLPPLPPTPPESTRTLQSSNALMNTTRNLISLAKVEPDNGAVAPADEDIDFDAIAENTLIKQESRSRSQHQDLDFFGNTRTASPKLGSRGGNTRAANENDSPPLRISTVKKEPAANDIVNAQSTTEADNDNDKLPPSLKRVRSKDPIHNPALAALLQKSQGSQQQPMQIRRTSSGNSSNSSPNRSPSGSPTGPGARSPADSPVRITDTRRLKKPLSSRATIATTGRGLGAANAHANDLTNLLLGEDMAGLGANGEDSLYMDDVKAEPVHDDEGDDEGEDDIEFDGEINTEMHNESANCDVLQDLVVTNAKLRFLRYVPRSEETQYLFDRQAHEDAVFNLRNAIYKIYSGLNNAPKPIFRYTASFIMMRSTQYQMELKLHDFDASERRVVNDFLTLLKQQAFPISFAQSPIESLCDSDKFSTQSNDVPMLVMENHTPYQVDESLIPAEFVDLFVAMFAAGSFVVYEAANMFSRAGKHVAKPDFFPQVNNEEQLSSIFKQCMSITPFSGPSSASSTPASSPPATVAPRVLGLGSINGPPASRVSSSSSVQSSPLSPTNSLSPVGSYAGSPLSVTSSLSSVMSSASSSPIIKMSPMSPSSVFGSPISVSSSLGVTMSDDNDVLVPHAELTLSSKLPHNPVSSTDLISAPYIAALTTERGLPLPPALRSYSEFVKTIVLVPGKAPPLEDEDAKGDGAFSAKCSRDYTNDPTSPEDKVLFNLSMGVNKSFEGAFGYTQRELRALLIKDPGFLYTKFMTPETSRAMFRELALGSVKEHFAHRKMPRIRFFGTVIDKNGEDIPCVLTARLDFDVKPLRMSPDRMVLTFDPLPLPYPSSFSARSASLNQSNVTHAPADDSSPVSPRTKYKFIGNDQMFQHHEALAESHSRHNMWMIQQYLRDHNIATLKDHDRLLNLQQ